MKKQNHQPMSYLSYKVAFEICIFGLPEIFRQWRGEKKNAVGMSILTVLRPWENVF